MSRNTLFDRRPTSRPLVLGHRGAPVLSDDNTLESFGLALAAGADGVELDVRSSADGVLVVHHDAAQRGIGTFSELDFAAIRASAPLIPTLEEALDVLEGSIVNIEIKNDPQEPGFDPAGRLAARVVEMIVRRGLTESVLLSSFHPGTVVVARSLDPRIATGLLVAPGMDLRDACRAASTAGHDAVHLFVGMLAGDALEKAGTACEEAGLKMVVWTVNEPNEMARLAAAEADAIITDDPGLAVARFSAPF